MIKITHILAEGFGSISEPVSFDLDRAGVNLMVAPNGSGKTTIWSALMWCLYQTNLKGLTNEKVQTWEHKRHKGFRGTRVSVTLEKDGIKYKIVRHLNFRGSTQDLSGGSKLMLFISKGDEWILQGDGLHKADMEAEIEKILGLDKTTFLNSVLFGQRMVRLVSMDNADKRKLFENLFDMSFIDAMRKKAKEVESVLSESVREMESTHRVLSTKIDNLEDSIRESERVVETFEREKEARLLSINEVISKYKYDIEDYKDDIKEAKKLMGKLTGEDEEAPSEDAYYELREAIELDKEELREMETKKSKVETERNKAINARDKYEAELKAVETTCPYCKRDMPEDKVKEAVVKLKKLIEGEKAAILAMESITKLEKPIDAKKEAIRTKVEEIKKLKELLEDYKKNKSAVEGYKNTMRTAKLHIENAEANIATRELEYKNEKAKQPPELNLDSKKDDVKKLIITINKLTDELVEINTELDKCLWWINTALASKGLKSYVFSAMLQQLNNHIKKYGDRLGIIISMGVDMSKATRPFTTTCLKDGYSVDYDELSGGEKTRVDVALAFAMHDLISMTTDINILIMDETFEGLDEQGMEVAFGLIRLKAVGGKSVYVITHTQSADVLNAHTIEIIKEGTQTRIA